MAISAKMLAVIQKVDAARSEFYAALVKSARLEAQARVEKSKKKRIESRRRKQKAPDPDA